VHDLYHLHSVGWQRWYDWGVKRLLHILRNAAPMLSLVLCGLTLVLWALSYRQMDWFSYTRSNGDWFFANMEAQLRDVARQSLGLKP
jgi:hypothetical protein